MEFHRMCMFICVLFQNSFAGCPRTNGKLCCFGHYWDESVKSCKVCKIGYFGQNCSMKCPYPNYGAECQLECTCNARRCNPFIGCVSGEETTFYTYQTFRNHTVITTNKDNKHFTDAAVDENNTWVSPITTHSTEDKPDVSRLNLTNITLLGIFGALGTICVFLGIFLSLYIKEKFKRNKVKLKGKNYEQDIQRNTSYASLNSVELEVPQSTQIMFRKDNEDVTSVSENTRKGAHYHPAAGYIEPIDVSNHSYLEVLEVLNEDEIIENNEPEMYLTAI
ncbi:uncharacterized protein LOC134243451 [Saccostrea cucullata]|uniref:uncharacterized protein LOC134243451 n=1 Tax=Saccostrea cuccullata TaxID=36930 RepID=UPI002ED53829